MICFVQFHLRSFFIFLFIFDLRVAEASVSVFTCSHFEFIYLFIHVINFFLALNNRELSALTKEDVQYLFTNTDFGSYADTVLNYGINGRKLCRSGSPDAIASLLCIGSAAEADVLWEDIDKYIKHGVPEVLLVPKGAGKNEYITLLTTFGRNLHS